MTSVFTQALKKREVKAKQFDADGNEVQFDVREDEEQASYLDQTVELLLAAGYFRARIKLLSAFDKVVGGMTWCIISSNVEVDVDLLFQENSSIKDKIALTEKIVAALNRMKCPHRLEPYQIQGLDFIHIYPVVQWLVKTAIETREEMNRQIRARAVFEFKKTGKTPEDVQWDQGHSAAVVSLVAIKAAYKPRRQFKPKSLDDVTPEARVTTTLLEYGRRYGLSRAPKKENSTPTKNVAKALQGGAGVEEEDVVAAEEKRIKSLMSTMDEADQGTVSTTAIGSIVGKHTSTITLLSAEYQQQQANLEAGESERNGGASSHKRVVASLQKQIDNLNRKIIELQNQHDEIYAKFKDSQSTYQEVAGNHAELLAKLEQLDILEGDETNQAILSKLRNLVSMHSMLEEQEKLFKNNCKAEMNEWKEKTAAFEVNGVVADDEHTKEVTEQLNEEEAKLQKLRIQLAKRNRETAALQRSLDQIPTRGELTQYQQRFLDLNIQSTATLREHKQFFALYNTQANKQTCMTQEVAFLNSIHDNFDRALQDKTSKESFLTQLTTKVGAFKANRDKADERLTKEKGTNDSLSLENANLIDQERLYYKTVMDYEHECSRNEKLLARLKKRSGQ